MTFDSILWTTNGTGDGASGGYTQAQVVDWMRRSMIRDITTQVVLKGRLNELAVSNPAGKTIRVASGAGYADGFPFDNDANVDLTPSTPATLPRVDRCIVRVDWTAQTVRAVILEGTEGAGTPPTLTQTSGTTWEVSLAQYEISTGDVISNLTDEREFLHFNTEVDGADLDDASVDTAQIADDAITRDLIDDNAIVAAALDSTIAGAGLVGGGGSALAVNPDDVTLEISSDILQVKDGGIDNDAIGNLAVDTAELANDAVDDTKAGDRIIQMYRRQGGDASDWSTYGVSSYTPGAVRQQVGAARWTGTSSPIGTGTITFPTALSDIPVVFIQYNRGDYGDIVFTVQPSSTGFTYYWRDQQNNSHTAVNFFWLAIGPE